MHGEPLRQHLSAPSQTSLHFNQAFRMNCSSLQNCNFEHITSLNGNLPLSKKQTHDVAETRVDKWLSESLALIINLENYFKSIYSFGISHYFDIRYYF